MIQNAREPIENAELVAFVRTVEERSLSRAAVVLKQPRATISRRLARLEERLGARLLRRTTRSLSLTDAGEALYHHARLVLDAVQQAEASVRRGDGELAGDLRVSLPPMEDDELYDLVTSFAARHPLIRLQVHFASRHVDLRRDGYDVALRAGTIDEPGLVVRSLYRAKTLAVASPKYLEEHGTPRTVKDLKEHRCLMGFARGELPQTQWPVGRGTTRHVDGALFSNDPRFLHFAALRGLGIALVPSQLACDDLAKGRLVHVLPGIVEMENQLAVVYAERELIPPAVRAFVDALVAWRPTFLRRHPSMVVDGPDVKRHSHPARNHGGRGRRPR